MKGMMNNKTCASLFLFSCYVLFLVHNTRFHQPFFYYLSVRYTPHTIHHHAFQVRLGPVIGGVVGAGLEGRPMAESRPRAAGSTTSPGAVVAVPPRGGSDGLPAVEGPPRVKPVGVGLFGE